MKAKVADSGVQVLDYRPHNEHGPPLELLCEAFGQFSQDAATCTPSSESCALARRLVAHVSQVLHFLTVYMKGDIVSLRDINICFSVQGHVDELKDLQPEVQSIFDILFSGVGKLRAAERRQEHPDLWIEINGSKILYCEQKPVGGNPRGQNIVSILEHCPLW